MFSIFLYLLTTSLWELKTYWPIVVYRNAMDELIQKRRSFQLKLYICICLSPLYTGVDWNPMFPFFISISLFIVTNFRVEINVKHGICFIIWSLILSKTHYTIHSFKLVEVLFTWSKLIIILFIKYFIYSKAFSYLWSLIINS